MLRRVNDKFLVLAARFASQGTRTISTMILARCVAKEDYGRLGLIMAVPGLLAAVGDLGISRSVVNRTELPDEEVRDTALVLMVSLSLALAAVSIASGWWYDIDRNDPRLRWVGLMIAATFVVQGIQSVQLAILQRELRFTRWAGIEFLTMCATVAIGISLALAGGGIFALAAQQLLPPIVGILITIRAKPLRWPKRLRRATAGAFYSFGWRASLFQYANNVQVPVSNLIIAGPLGALADSLVGQYGRALQVRDLPGQNLVSTFDLVLSPLLARSRDHPERLRDLYIRGTVAITMFLSLVAAWFIVVAPDLIRVFLGATWAEVPPILRALSPGLVSLGIGYTGLLVALALNRPLVNFACSMAVLAVLGVAGIAYWYTDLWTFCIVQAVGSAWPMLFIARWAAHAVGMSLRSVLLRIAPLLLIAAFVGGTSWGLQLSLTQLAANGFFGTFVRLATVSLFGLGLAWGLIHRFNRDNYECVRSLIVRPTAATHLEGA